MDPVRHFGRNVQAARKARGWTQEQLADRAGLAQVQVSRVERGVRNIKLTTMVQLLSALQCEPNELFRDLYVHSANSERRRRQVSPND